MPEVGTMPLLSLETNPVASTTLPQISHEGVFTKGITKDIKDDKGKKVILYLILNFILFIT